MKITAKLRAGLLVLGCLIGSGFWLSFPAWFPVKQALAQRSMPPSAKEGFSRAYGQLPITFEANAGQFQQSVRFVARGAGYALWLTDQEAVLQLRRSVLDSKTSAPEISAASSATLRMRFVGAQPSPRFSGLEPLPSRSHYFLGNDSRRWRTDVANFARVRSENIYPGIDVVWYGNQRQLEYDFVLKPGARAERIRWSFAGAASVRAMNDGAVEVRGRFAPEENESAALRLLPPVAWQMVNGERRLVKCAYRVHAGGEITLKLGAYDRRRELVIDPVLAYSTLVGGMGVDQAWAIAVDGEGNAYVAGSTDSADFPGPSTIQPARGGQNDVFIAKLNPSGSALVWATWLGGSANDIPNDLALDATGNVYVTGQTGSANFPLKNALQTERKGTSDAFLAKLDPAGTALVYSTYLGGAGAETANALAVDAQGSAYVAGSSDSLDFPTVQALQREKRGASLYSSPDGGASWTGNSGLQTRQVYDVAFEPGSQTTFYAATDQGIFKTTNSGGTWSRIGEAQIFGFVPQLVIHPTEAQTLYAVWSGGIFRSTDGGANWTRLSLQGSVRAMALDPNAPNNLYALLVASDLLLKSQDGGLTWTSLRIQFFSSIAQPDVIAIDPATAHTIYAGTTRGLFKSTNGGANWNFSGAGISSGFPNDSILRFDQLAISRSNPGVLYTNLRSGPLYKSTNGGANWSIVQGPIELSNALTLEVAIDPNNAEIVYLSTNTFPNALFKTVNGGVSWQRVAGGFYGESINAIAIPPFASQTIYVGGFAGTDVFISQFDPNGSALTFSTYLGGLGSDYAVGLAVDATGVYVAGGTTSPDFPLANAYQNSLRGRDDAFVTKLSPGAAVVRWSTFLGSSEREFIEGLAINAAGNVFVTGSTSGTDFPVVRAAQSVNRSQMFERVDGFVTRFSVDGRQLDYSTYLGGNNSEFAYDLAVDAADNVYITGYTFSTDFPLIGRLREQTVFTTPRLLAFVTKLKADGSAWDYSVLLGGQGTNYGQSIAVDAAGNAYVAGRTTAEDFPVTPNALRKTGPSDAFVAKLHLSADLELAVSDLPDPAQVNGTLVYTLTVANNGPDAASDVRVTDTLPDGVTFVSATSSTGSCSGSGPVVCNLGRLENAARATVTITVKPLAAGTLTNRATVTSATDDANGDNNAATQQTRIGTLPSIFGRVTLSSGAGLEGVTVALGGSQRPVVRTNPDGSYQFAELAAGGDYTVTPALDKHVFNPPSRAFNNLTTDQRADFSAVSCVFTLSASEQTFPATGGAGVVTLNAPDARCAWTARSNANWIKLTDADATGILRGSGAAQIRFTVEPTVGGRSGTLTIGERTFNVFQQFYPCPAASFSSNAILTQVSLGFVSKAIASDFNKDGRADIAFLQTNSASLPSVSVAFGQEPAQGKDVLAAPVRLSGTNTAAAYQDVRAGDLNGDGFPDLAVVGTPNGTAQTVLLWMNNGAQGGFAAVREIPLANRPTALALGDYNGDNRLDLLIGVNSGEQMLIALPSEGAGNFGAARTLLPRVERFADRIDPADVDGDGKLDLFLSNENDGYAIYRGDGAGGFSPHATLASGGGYGRAVGDFNGDRRPDAVFNDGDELRVWLNDGAGRYPAATNVVRLNQPFLISSSKLLAADFNADGRDDLLLAAFNGGSRSEGMLLLLGHGNGGFSPAESYLSTLSFARSIIMAAGDVTGDGLPDVVTFEYDASFSKPGVGLLRGLPGGALAAPRGIFLGGRDGFSYSPPYRLVAGDVDGDGAVDLVTNTSGGLTFRLQFGDGRGNFSETRTLETSAFATDIILRDFNRDGRADLAALNNNNLIVWLSLGRGVFAQPLTYNIGQRATQLRTGDFNRDGRMDLAAFGATTSFAVFLNQWANDGGAGGFMRSARQNFEVESHSFLHSAVGDVDGDGRADLLLTDYKTEGQSLLLARGDGQGGFAAPGRTPFNEIPDDLTLADVNYDGRDDLIYLFGADLRVALSLGDGTFQTPVNYTSSRRVYRMALRDFNNDGRLDVAATGTDGGKMILWFGQANGAFGNLQEADAFGAPYLAAAADFNQDGAVDLAIGRSGEAVGGVLFNRAVCAPPASVVAVSAASFNAFTLAPESISALFGTNLAATTEIATTTPLPTQLAGASVRVRDSQGRERNAPLFFVSPNQINWQIPPGLAAGVAVVSVANGNNTVATGTINLVPVSPALFTANAAGEGLAAAVVLRVRADGSQVFEAVARLDQNGRFVAVPIDLSDEREQVFLLLFGTGIRGGGVPANVKASAGGVAVEVQFAGPQGGFAGLDQINLRLPRSLAGSGEINVFLTVDGKAANPVSISVK